MNFAGIRLNASSARLAAWCAARALRGQLLGRYTLWGWLDTGVLIGTGLRVQSRGTAWDQHTLSATLCGGALVASVTFTCYL